MNRHEDNSKVNNTQASTTESLKMHAAEYTHWYITLHDDAVQHYYIKHIYYIATSY